MRTAWIGRAERGEVDREGLLNGLLDLYATDLKCEVRVTVVETIDLEGSKRLLGPVISMGRCSRILRLWGAQLRLPVLSG